MYMSTLLRVAVSRLPTCQSYISVVHAVLHVRLSPTCRPTCQTQSYVLSYMSVLYAVTPVSVTRAQAGPASHWSQSACPDKTSSKRGELDAARSFSTLDTQHNRSPLSFCHMHANLDCYQFDITALSFENMKYDN